MMSWLLPLVIFVGALLDALFVYIYMNFAHPWIDILSTGFSSTLTFFDISVLAEGYGMSCFCFLVKKNQKMCKNTNLDSRYELNEVFIDSIDTLSSWILLCQKTQLCCLKGL